MLRNQKFPRTRKFQNWISHRLNEIPFQGVKDINSRTRCRKDRWKAIPIRRIFSFHSKTHLLRLPFSSLRKSNHRYNRMKADTAWLPACCLAGHSQWKTLLVEKSQQWRCFPLIALRCILKGIENWDNMGNKIYRKMIRLWSAGLKGWSCYARAKIPFIYPK